MTPHIIEGQDPELDKTYRSWRIRAFLGTWLAYAGFYLCRKTIAVAQPEYMKQFGWGEELVGIILTGYHISYSAGQFLNGALGDKFGPRKMLLSGIVTTILMNILFGFSASITLMGVFWTINGFAQSMGWPNVVKGMTNWFSVRERGTVMGPWGTCYAVGDIAGTALASFVIGRAVTQHIVNPAGQAVTYHYWPAVFWVAAAALSIVAVIALTLFRNKPQDLGLPGINTYHQIPSSEPETDSRTGIIHNTRDVLRRRPVWILGMSYLGIKFIRYTFMFWAVTYFNLNRGIDIKSAGYMSVAFPLGGFLGTILASYLSDKLFQSRRAPISVLMLIGLMGSLVFMWQAPNALIPWALGLVGFMTFGPDFVVSAVAVMDFGTQRGAATAAGFVNGMGSIGQAFSGAVIGVISGLFGWQIVFLVLIGVAFCCAALLSTMWNTVAGD